MESALYQAAPEGLILIETLRYTPEVGPVRGMLHLDRMARSAALLGFAFDRLHAAALLDGVSSPDAQRLRLTLQRDGALRLERFPLTPPAKGWRVQIASTPVQSDDPWLQVKSSNRALYDAARADLPADVHEWVFLNERGELAEGSITTLFVAAEDILLTPPLSAGCLPGILRQDLLAQGRAREAVLMPDDLRAGFFMGNALRGLIRAQLIQRS